MPFNVAEKLAIFVAGLVLALGAPGVAVGVGVGVGVGPECAQYLPPVSRSPWPPNHPPQTIISLPVQTAVWEYRGSGALVVLVAVQVFVLGWYRPPVSKEPLLSGVPPQTIISLPVQTAV